MRHITIKLSKATNGYIIEDKTGCGVETHIAESHGKVEEIFKGLLAKLDSGSTVSSEVASSPSGPKKKYNTRDDEDWE